MPITASPLLYMATGAKKLQSSSSTNWVNATYPPRVNGHSYRDSHNNKWRPGPKGNRDVGSNWTLHKSSVARDIPDIDITRRRNFVWYGYRGGAVVHDDAFVEPSDFLGLVSGASSEAHLMALGSTAISRVIPTNPIADLPQGIAELLREGLPQIPGFDIGKHRRITGGQLASNYLNYDFGIAPMLRDMRAFAAAYARAEELIAQYAQNAGRKIRRRYEFDPEISSTSGIVPNPTTQGRTHLAGPGTEVGIQDFFLPTRGGSPGTRYDSTTVVKKQWFSGAFTYYLPNAGKEFSSKLAREEAEMRHLYGGISVNTAWNLIPFSWAADWISNAGDVIHNVAAFARDGLVMPYGYIMESLDCVNRRTLTGAYCGTSSSTYNAGQVPSIMSMTLTHAYKRRRKATPYGFGLSFDGFSTRQYATMAALGIANLYS